MYAPYGFTALTGQNAASTQAKNMQPGMPGYTGLDSMKFDQMRTPEDQIHWLYLYASTLDMNTLDVDTAQSMIDASAEALKAYADAQDAGIKVDVDTKYNYLLRLINQLEEFPGTVFDPTYGDIRPIKSVCEHIYDFDRPFSVTAVDYDTCGMTAYFYESNGYSARDFDTCFALLSYDFYAQLVHNGVSFARNEDTLILV
jgi:hypothetical protein